MIMFLFSYILDEKIKKNDQIESIIIDDETISNTHNYRVENVCMRKISISIVVFRRIKI